MPVIAGNRGMSYTENDRDLLLSILEKTYRLSRNVLAKELGRTPTATEVAQRTIRAVEYTCRCRHAVDSGKLAPDADDRRLLAQADQVARGYAQTEGFNQLSALLSKWLGHTEIETVAKVKGGRDE